MSRRVDEERAAAAREMAVRRGREFARKLTRMVELYAQGFTSEQVGEALGFSTRHLKRLRKAARMTLGGARWRS